jgi:PAS domain S-box-containing protein
MIGQKWSQRLSERWRNALWLTTGLLLAGALLFAANWEADRQERVRIDSFRGRAADLARISESIIAGQLRKFDDSLLILRDSYIADPNRFAENIQLLRSGPLADRELLVVLVDRDGYLSYPDTPNVKPGLYRGDQPYFRYFAEGGKDIFYISAPVFGRVTNLYSVPLVRPIYDKQGYFLGVVAFFVKQDSITNFGSRLQLSWDPTITVVNHGGAVVSRSRDLAKVQGTNLPPELLAPMLEGPEGVFSSRATPDSVERIIAYRHIHNEETPLIIYVEASPGNVLHEISLQRTLFMWGAGFTSLVIMFLIVAYLKGRKVTAKLIETLRRSKEQEYKTIIRTSLDGFWVADGSGQILDTNKTFCKMLGYTREVLLLLSVPDIEAVESPEQVVAHFRTIVEAGSDRFQSRYRHRDGTIIDVEISAQYVKESGGRFFVFVRDITDRKRTKDALRESEKRHRTILQTAMDGFWLVDTQGRLLEVNETYCRMSGYSAQELLAMRILDLEVAEAAHNTAARIQKIMAKGEDRFESRHRRKDGSIFDVEVSVQYRPVEGGRFVAFLRDITGRKQAEEERQNLEERLNRAEKMEALGTLACGVAHDLNNVLGVVVGYSEMLLGGVDKSSPLRHGLENVMSGGLKAAAIVDDLLTLVRRGVPGRSILNLNKIIADCQQSPEFANLSFHHPSVKIKTDIDPDLLNISGSSVHLGKSLYNLLSNASEAMAKGSGVTIKTTNQYLDKPIQGYDQIREGDYVVLSVSDKGEGIHEADLKRIFEPFYAKKVMGRSGTGLGLAVVWGTVKDHHGYINVQSEEGKGSTFTLYFPVTREEITTEAFAVAISEYMGKGESILVVDDLKEQRDLAAGMLRTLNYNVSSVSSGEDAVAYLKEHEVDLIVLDMIMDPGMDGLDTYRSVLDIHPKQKAIIVSGFLESDRMCVAKSLGTGAFVRKPYIKEKLGLAVRKELDRPARTREH